jgi:hypothetical protein
MGTFFLHVSLAWGDAGHLDNRRPVCTEGGSRSGFGQGAGEVRVIFHEKQNWVEEVRVHVGRCWARFEDILLIGRRDRFSQMKLLGWNMRDFRSMTSAHESAKLLCER